VVREAGSGFAWEERMDPIVHVGPQLAPMGHSLPAETALQPGHLIHVDLGLIRDGFASDLQRTWYWLRDDEKGAPEPVMKTFAPRGPRSMRAWQLWCLEMPAMLWTPPLGRRSWSADSQNRNLPLDTMLVGWRTTAPECSARSGSVMERHPMSRWNQGTSSRLRWS